MWNKKSEPDPRPRGTMPGSEPVAPTRPSPTPAASAPAPPFRPELPRHASVLGRGVIVKGQIVSGEDLTIDGDVEGTIELKEHRLTIGASGRVQVDKVTARELVVLGSLKGSVDALDKVYIKKDAQLVGDVQTVGIVIEDGAYFKGGIDIRKAKIAPEAPRAATDAGR